MFQLDDFSMEDIGYEMDPYYADQLEDYDSVEDMCNQMGLNYGDIPVKKEFSDEGQDADESFGLQTVDIMSLFGEDFDGCDF